MISMVPDSRGSMLSQSARSRSRMDTIYCFQGQGGCSCASASMVVVPIKGGAAAKFGLTGFLESGGRPAVEGVEAAANLSTAWQPSCPHAVQRQLRSSTPPNYVYRLHDLETGRTSEGIPPSARRRMRRCQGISKPSR